MVSGTTVSTGNPHFVIVVDNPDFAADGQAWQSVGQQICFLPDFPFQTNVEFIRVIVGRNEIEIRIFERGVGPTTSSGTGSARIGDRRHCTKFGGIAAHGLRTRRPTDRRVERARDRVVPYRTCIARL